MKMQRIPPPHRPRLKARRSTRRRAHCPEARYLGVISRTEFNTHLEQE